MRYAAFISYSHSDRRSAQWLHRSIESYRLPKQLAVALGPQIASSALRPIFLDRAELSSSTDLAGAVRAALNESAALVVICSRAAAASRWVNEEVRTFKALGRSARVFCLIVDGEPANGECFPPALRFAVENEQVTTIPASEPLAADLRHGRDDRGTARLKIIAGLLDVPLDRLRQRELVRRQRRLVIVASLSAIGCVVFGTMAVMAIRERREADHQRMLADQQTLTARRTADFMKSLFAVSDPSEARGNTITAREVLDRGARQIMSQLKDTPQVRVDLTTTLGEVYASLGLLNDSKILLDGAMAIQSRPPELTAKLMAAVGDVQNLRGDYDAALSALSESTKATEDAEIADPLLRLRVLSTYGDVYMSKNDITHARSYFLKAFELATGASSAERTIRAHAIEGIAQADLSEKRFDAAADGFQKAFNEQVAATGALHPRASEILNEMGSLEYMRGRPEVALTYFGRCLAIQRQLFGARNPTTAITLNNFARLLLEQRRFVEADEQLSESVDSRVGNVVETGDLMAFLFSNLALARMGLGDLKSAEPLFQKGLTAAIANQHRLHGPILTDLADLECRSKRFDQGLKRLDEARPIVAARYPNDPWRVAHVDNVRAGCLTGLKRYAEADNLVESSLPIVLKKWPPDSLFGHDALERTMRLYRATGNSAKLAKYTAMAKAK